MSRVAGGFVGVAVAAALPLSPAVARVGDPARDESRAAALDCLATAIAYEAGREPPEGQAAVARVVLNRVAHPAFPKTVCGVVHQGSRRRTGCQFTFTCDGALRRRLPAALLAAARVVAAQALDGDAGHMIGAATHYHATYVNPYWTPALVAVATIGLHRFYRFPGTPGDAPPTTDTVINSRNGQFTAWGLTVAITEPEKN